MIEFVFAGRIIPSIENQINQKENWIESLGPFKEELEKHGITFVFYNPPEEYEQQITWSAAPPDFAYRFSHYRKTGEYIPPSPHG